MLMLVKVKLIGLRERLRMQLIVTLESNMQVVEHWDYCEMVRKPNPGSCCKLKVEVQQALADSNLHMTHLRRFERPYIRLHAQKQGILSGCRPISGLDGCHLKRVYGGKLLSAVERYRNENLFPIAMAVAEAETKDSWTSFLMKDIGVQKDIESST